jgi:hypothetical protein
VAERARLESVCTGNRTAGSNPALSAISRRTMSQTGVVTGTREVCVRGRVRTRGWREGGWSVVGRVWTRGGVGGRRDAGCSAIDRSRGGECGGWVMRWATDARCSRHPALSAISCGAMSPRRMAAWRGEPHGRGRVRTLSAVIFDLSSFTGHRGKQGARVPRDGAPRTSSGPEGSSDKGNATGATVPPGSLLRHGGTRGTVAR